MQSKNIPPNGPRSVKDQFEQFKEAVLQRTHNMYQCYDEYHVVMIGTYRTPIVANQEHPGFDRNHHIVFCENITSLCFDPTDGEMTTSFIEKALNVTVEIQNVVSEDSEWVHSCVFKY